MFCSFYFLSFALFCSAIYQLIAQALAFNATFDSCQTTDQCELTLICAYEKRGSVIECSETTTNDNCSCRYLLFPSYCHSTRYKCPIKYDACGKSLTKPELDGICVSCNLLNQPDSDFIPVDNKPVCQFSSQPLPSPSPSPQPPGRNFDWCSVHNPCHPDYACFDLDSGLCVEESIACYCSAKNTRKVVCQNPTQCSHPRETCVRDITRDNTFCVSCSIAITDPNLVSFSNDSSCDKFTPIPTPSYEPPSSGLSFDGCLVSLQCYTNYKCYQAGQPPLTLCSKNDTVCSCFRNTEGPKLCDTTADCPSGEVCAKLSGYGIQACTSVSYFRQRPDGLFKVSGTFPKRGTRVKEDPCQGDHQCVEGMYCTHRSGDQRLGGCLGRRACACTGLSLMQCASRKNCRKRETCVFIPDSLREPFCYSAKSANLNPYIRDLRAVSAKPTPTILPTDGWTFDVCLNDDDCMQDIPRKCQHRVSNKPCRGREMCNCVVDSGHNDLDSCSDSTDCSFGEACVTVVDLLVPAQPQCISRKLLELDFFKRVYVEVAGNSTQPISSPSPSSSPSSSPTKSSSLSPSTSPSPSLSESSAQSSHSAIASPSVTSPVDETSPGGETAVSPSLTMETESEVCVDVDALSHLRPSELVYNRPRRAIVLCDKFGSCATPGHVIMWQESAMLMHTYCKSHTRCVRAIKYVNSPRLKRLVRIPSHTKGLLYTPLAARFVSRLEESLLRGLIRFGW